MSLLTSGTNILRTEHLDGSVLQVARFALTGETSLYILLPVSYKAADLQQVEERMTDTNVREMVDHLKSTNRQQIEVTLPQIKLDVQPDMNILMKKLGLFLFSVCSHFNIELGSVCET